MNKRIEESREKWNIVQNESTDANKQSYGLRTFRLTLEQELVIKGNLSEMYVYNNNICILQLKFNFNDSNVIYYSRGSSILELEKKIRNLRTIVNTISS